MQIKQNNTQHLPLVSFIVTCYNLPPQLLRQCLDSLMALPMVDGEREIILIDDGSDSSPVSELTDLMPHLVYIRQPNGGLSAARNRGLAVATGIYLQFIDGDDMLLPSYSACIEQARLQQHDMIISDFCDHPDAQPSDTPSLFSEPISGTDYMSRHNLHATACGYLFRHEILGHLRFTTGIVHEDEEFTPQLLLRAENVVATTAQTYFYRRRPQSITTDTGIRRMLKRLADKQSIIIRLNHTADTLPAAERKALQRRVTQMTMDYIYDVIIQTRNRHYLDRKLQVLSQNGLYPLPPKRYTAKYTWFRILANNRAGLSLLSMLLPRMAKEP